MSEKQLIFVMGDQLNADGSAFEGADPDRDIIAMAEVEDEILRFPNHRQRVVLFLSAMRHFRDRLRERGFTVKYQQIGDDNAQSSFTQLLKNVVREHEPARLVMTEPGRQDLVPAIISVAADAGIPTDIRPDTHFLATHEDFDAWAADRKTLVMEYFYREMRKRYGVLMRDGKPIGNAWNFDKENRGSFGRSGPKGVRAPRSFAPDATTKAVIAAVCDRYPDLYGATEAFDWPVTPEDAGDAVDDFVTYRLPYFGDYQDAMWTDQPFLFHSRVSTALNLKLVHPREVIERAIEAFDEGHAPLAAVEGFVRQILGWREFLRGVYWRNMPGYQDGNALRAKRELPELYWTGETDMTCMRQVVRQLLHYGYAHHIQRLMVTGLFSLLFGVEPRQIHAWYMALFVDSVEWVTLPNTIGMSQFADGGIVGTKPYAATGKYIRRMSNYCANCRYHPVKAVGDDACPFTTLYWDFLMRHEGKLKENRRMAFQLRNLSRKSSDERNEIAKTARRIFQEFSECRPKRTGQ